MGTERGVEVSEFYVHNVLKERREEHRDNLYLLDYNNSIRIIINESIQYIPV
jgi:hypothetical protein